MKFISFIFSVSIFLSSISSVYASGDLSTSQMVSQGAIVEEKKGRPLNGFFDHYLQSYNDFLVDGSVLDSAAEPASYFNMPTMQIPSRGLPRVSSSYESMNQGLTSFLKSLKDKSIVQLRWESVRVELLRDDLAIADNVVQAVDKNGSVKRRMSALYLLQKIDMKWRISVLAQHSPENQLRFE